MMKSRRNQAAGDAMQVAAMAILAGAAIIAVVAGCVSTEELAPLPGPAHRQYAEAKGFDPESLSRGRQIYLVGCARCHSPEPVTNYTARQWEEILPRMAAESRLDDREQADLRAYIFAVLEAKPEGPQ